MDLRLHGKCAAVAAASSGLGFAVARALAAEGMRVSICGRRREPLLAAAREINAVPIPADLASPEDARMFVDRSIAELGALDVLVINSGGPPVGTFASTSLDTYEAALEANLLSAVAMCQSAIPAMQRTGWGRIVAITSLSARQPRPGNIVTGMARAGLTAFLKALSIDVAASGITVNTLQPGPHRTSRLEQVYGGGSLDEVIGKIPARALGRPEDFGQVAAFLCSEQARFITGSSLPVDGGMYSGLY